MMSSRPVSRTARSTSPCTADTSRTSSTTTVPRPPAASMRARDASIASCVRPARNTCAPAAPRVSAIARPMPLDAPVTTAVLPARAGLELMTHPPSGCAGSRCSTVATFFDILDLFCQYAQPMPRPATATRERILAAAFARFAHYGFRRTSMEDIAAEAGVSRAALYLQFRNKEEIFRSLSRDLHEEALAGAAAALEGRGPLADRLRAAVEAKTLRFVEIANTSAHAMELLDERDRLCGDLPTDSERRFRDALARVFRRAAQTGEVDLAAVNLTPADAADLFASTVSGLKSPGVTVDSYRRRLAALVRVFVAGLGGAKRRLATRRTPARRRAV